MKSATKSASLESKQYFDEHKESTKSELHKISSKEDLSDKQKKMLTNLLLDDVRAKQGTDDFKKHAEVRKADYKKIRELVIERVGDAKKVTKEDIQDAVDFFYGKSEKKESKETSTNLPSDVTSQEKKAITYFEGQPKYLKVIENIQKLRAEGKITYEDLWWGKYAVIMPCGNKKLRMGFPAYTKLADSSYNYTDFDGKEITKKETTRWKLWSKEWKKYLEQKEKEWQKFLSESEFKTLISSLLPDGNQEEQILAFMLATWFYGWMWLADKIWDYQRAVRCCRLSVNRVFRNMDFVLYHCSLVHSSFVG
jgi:hypothetical protein